MPTSINYPPDARGKWSLPILLVLISLAVLSFFVHFPLSKSSLLDKPPSKSSLLDKLTSCLREEKFEPLYDEMHPEYRRRVSREKFVGRMKEVAAKLKAVDPELKFQRDDSMEGRISQDEAVLLASFQKLQGAGKSVRVYISWHPNGILYDMSVTPEYGTPEEYTVVSVTMPYRKAGGPWMNE